VVENAQFICSPYMLKLIALLALLALLVSRSGLVSVRPLCLEPNR